MRVGIGATLTWDDEQFIIIAADYRHVTLRSLDADFTRVVDAEELVRLTNVTWHTERVESATGSAARVLDGLHEQERRIVDAWAEQLSRVKEAVDRGEPAKYLFEDVRAVMSKLTTATSLETVRRKFHRYCAEGVIGLVDARHLNRGKRDIDARIGAALSELGAKGRRGRPARPVGLSTGCGGCWRRTTATRSTFPANERSTGWSRRTPLPASSTAPRSRARPRPTSPAERSVCTGPCAQASTCRSIPRSSTCPPASSTADSTGLN